MFDPISYNKYEPTLNILALLAFSEHLITRSNFALHHQYPRTEPATLATV